MRKHLLAMAAATMMMAAAYTTTALAGWQQDGSGWRFEENGSYAAGGFRSIDGGTYHFSEDGRMDTGWVEADGSRYYFYPDGKMAAGESVIDGSAYTFSPDGRYVRDGIHRDGMEDDLLSAAYVTAQENWELTQYAVQLMNEERAKVGVAPLRLDFDLTVVATYRCMHMDKYNYFSHVYNNDYPCDINTTAYTKRSAEVGENIYLYGDPHIQNNGITHDETMIAFVERADNWYDGSSGHHKNIVAPHSTVTGVGIFENRYHTRRYNTTIFD